MVEGRVRCIRRSAQTVKRSAKFRSSQAEIVRSTARSASQSARIAAAKKALKTLTNEINKTPSILSRLGFYISSGIIYPWLKLRYKKVS